MEFDPLAVHKMGQVFAARYEEKVFDWLKKNCNEVAAYDYRNRLHRVASVYAGLMSGLWVALDAKPEPGNIMLYNPIDLKQAGQLMADIEVLNTYLIEYASGTENEVESGD